MKHFQKLKPEINYKISTLPIGDFIIKNGDIILFIIERKTISDLASSIIDGRFREQKQRLLDTMGGPDKIMYILEGEKELNYGAISKSTINSCILNLIIKHQYKVLYTMDDMETYEMLLSLYNKLVDTDFKKIVEGPIKLIKKSHVLNNNPVVNMLSVIPGISINIAKKIEERYETLPILIESYNKLNDINEREKLLSDIKITDKRKIGVVLSKKIYNFLFVDKKCNKKEIGDTCLLD